MYTPSRVNSGGRARARTTPRAAVMVRVRVRVITTSFDEYLAVIQSWNVPDAHPIVEP